MNSGKSTQLLQIAHNYEQMGKEVLIYKPLTDTRDKEYVKSRIGLERKVDFVFGKQNDLYGITYSSIIFSNLMSTRRADCSSIPSDFGNAVDCILIDEAQFLTKKQVWQLTGVVDSLGISVIAFGLRTDFQGNLFEGSQWLLAWADDIQEIQTTSVCHCGKKARFNLRVNEDGYIVRDGEQVLCGGNDRYISVCRKHFNFLLARILPSSISGR